RVLGLRRDRPRRVRLPGPRAGRLAGGLALPLELYLGEPAGYPALSLVSMAGPSAGLGRRALALSPGPSGGRRRATGRALPAGRRVVLFEAAAAALPRLSLPGLAQHARCPVRDPAPVGGRRPVRLHRALAPDREPPDRRRHLAPAPAR